MVHRTLHALASAILFSLIGAILSSLTSPEPHSPYLGPICQLRQMASCLRTFENTVFITRESPPSCYPTPLVPQALLKYYNFREASLICPSNRTRSSNHSLSF